jgi:hypothetical protein
MAIRTNVTTPSTLRPSETPRMGMLYWLFYRNNQALTCELSVNGDQEYVVQVTPLWDDESSVCETFRRPTDALRRHAELATFLRDSGWLLAERGLVPSAA